VTLGAVPEALMPAWPDDEATVVKEPDRLDLMDPAEWDTIPTIVEPVKVAVSL
jgi:hypothetical protein